MKITKLFLLFYFLLTGLIGSAQCDRQADSLALVALYNQTDGPNWNNTWDLNQPLNTWFGIGLNGEGCVSFVQLINNGLVGTIPSELGTLSVVNRLQLNSNQLNGTIPSELGSLQNLVRLALFQNNLSGEIPSSLGDLSNLDLLLLYDNQLEGSLPPELGNLNNLSRLALYQNNLTGSVPASFGNLSNLEDLELAENQLSGVLPAELGNLLNLDYLALADNMFSGSPPASIGNIPNLRRISLSSNAFDGTLPEEWGNLTAVTSISLNDNLLTGTIPASYANITSLQRLDLGINNLTGCYPEEFLNTICDLGQNIGSTGYNFTSNPQLPWFGSMQLFCDGQSQTGAPCNDLNPATEIDVFKEDCSCAGVNCLVSEDSLALVSLYNETDGANWTNAWDLTQPMDTWFGVTLYEGGCVEGIDLNNQNLNGFIPDAFFELPATQFVIITNNPALTGSIPSSIGCPSLTRLDLSNNQLSGPIPNEIGGATALRFLNLSNNNINGPIPPDIGDLCDAEAINLCCNQMEGLVPGELAMMSNVDTLILNDNMLEGLFPTEYIVFCSIDSTDFTGNNLPNWGEFCDNAEGQETCDFAGGDLWCIEDVMLLSDSLICGGVWFDTISVTTMSAGTTEINAIPFAYYTIEGISPTGILSAESYFYGCQGVQVETCSSTSDTTICERGVLNAMDFEDLIFEELWTCAQDLPNCESSNTEIEDIDFRLHPNPFADLVTLQLDSNEPFVVTVFDINGTEVDRFENAKKLNLSDLASGVYILDVQFAEGNRKLARVLKIN